MLFDAGRKVLYVSNIDGEPWGDDGKGSIAKVGLDGKIIAVDWISGLSAPKGMAMRGSRLYVGDLTNVVVIDIDKGAIAERIAVSGSEGLNDVAIDSDGDGVRVRHQDKEGLRDQGWQVERRTSRISRARTGCCFTPARFTCSTAEGLYRVGKDRSLTLLSDGMKGGVDGVENVTGNDFIVSCWQGTVHYVKGDGTRAVLLDTHEQKINSADIGYDSEAPHRLRADVFQEHRGGVRSQVAVRL